MALGQLPAMISPATHRPTFRNQPLIHNNTMRALKRKDTDLIEYIVYARALSITWGEDSRYWRWVPLEDDKEVEVAELIEVCWLEARGKTKMNLLEPFVKYEAFFVVGMKDGSDVRPESTLILEAGKAARQERKVNLNVLPKNEWVRVKIGEFETGNVQQSSEEVKFSLTNEVQHNWCEPMKGLMIEGVLFLPTL